MKDYNRISHSELLKTSNDIDFIVEKGTNFKDFQSIVMFITDIINYEKIKPYCDSIISRGSKYNIVDMCSGSGVFGIALAKVLGGSGSIHFVDIVGEYHSTAIRLTKQILGDTFEPITHTCSADSTTISDNSIDIIIEVNGFHHVPSLSKVIKESQRILSPNGLLLGLDRIHENKVKVEELNKLLDAEYSAEWLKANNYIDKKLTRRDNGEGEIRLYEWEESLYSSGFAKPTLIEYVTRSKRAYKVWLISNLPEVISRLFLQFWIKPPSWSPRLLFTIISGISIKKSTNQSLIVTRKFPKNINSTLVRMEVIFANLI